MSDEMDPPVKGQKGKAAKGKDSKADPKPDAEKKPRKPREDWGYSKASTITLLKHDDKNYHGLRKEIYARVKKFDGKTVTQFAKNMENVESGKGTKQSSASWLKFFHDQGVIKLERPAEPEKKEEAA